MPRSAAPPAHRAASSTGYAAIDKDALTGEERCFRRKQELNHTYYIGGRAQSPQRGPANNLAALRGREAVSHFRLQISGRDGVHGDGARPELAGQRAGHAIERGLGGGIDGQAVVAAVADDGRDIQDPAAGTLEQHVANHRPGHIERAHEIGGHHRVDLRDGERCQHAIAGDAGVVDQGKGSAGALDHGVNGLVDGRGIGRVRLVKIKMIRLGGGGRFDERGAAPAEGGNRPSILQQGADDRLTQTASSAANDAMAHAALSCCDWRSSLPESNIERRSTKRRMRGRWQLGRPAQARAMAARSSSARLPGASTKSAATSCPASELATGYTRRSAIPGTRRSAVSTSTGETLLPPTLMISVLRPRNRTRPPEMSTRSPVAIQPAPSPACPS